MSSVSIIIPVYNVEAYLPQCLDSVISQSFTDLEILCVNDGSPDNSRKILAEYAQKDSRIKIIDRPNGGLSAARNTGVSAATGKYLYFLDSDDWLEPNAMELCYDTAEKDQLDEVILEFQQEYDTPAFKEKFQHILSDLSYDGVYSGEKLFAERYKNHDYFPCAWMRFINRDFYGKNKLCFYEGIIHEDELFAPQCDLLAKRAVYLKRYPLYHYRIREASIITASSAVKKLEAFCTIWHEFSVFLDQHSELQPETLEEIEHLQDYWLYHSGKLLKEAGSKVLNTIQVNRNLLLSFTALLKYNQLIHEQHIMIDDLTEQRNNIQERYDALIHSGSYRLAQIFGKILHKIKR